MAQVTEERIAQYPPIEPNYLEHIKSKNFSLYECDGCHAALLPVKNIRINNYCELCEPKKALIEKYTNKGNNLSEAERKRVFLTKTQRIGPLWPNPKAQETKKARRG